jgi:hypothetical protein
LLKKERMIILPLVFFEPEDPVSVFPVPRPFVILLVQDQCVILLVIAAPTEKKKAVGFMITGRRSAAVCPCGLGTFEKLGEYVSPAAVPPGEFVGMSLALPAVMHEITTAFCFYLLFLFGAAGLRNTWTAHAEAGEKRQYQKEFFQISGTIRYKWKWALSACSSMALIYE